MGTKAISLLILIITSMLVPLIQAEATSPVNVPIKWSCPPASGSSPPPLIPNPNDGNKPEYLYVHAVDSHGNDYEIWCSNEPSGTGNYLFYASFPNGTKHLLDCCEFYGGRNNVTLTINGSQELIPGIGQNYTINGTIVKVRHDNWVPWDGPQPPVVPRDDRGKDYHGDYVYNTGGYTRVDTKINKTTGNMEHILGAITLPHPLLVNSNENAISINPSESSSSSAAQIPSDLDLNNTILSYEITVPVNGETKTFDIYAPLVVGINSINLNNTSLIISLNSTHSNYMNLAIPKDLLNHPDAGSFQILVDNKPVSANENVTLTHRTLDFAIPQDAKMITIEGTTAVPEFGSNMPGLVLIIAMVSILAVFAKFRTSVYRRQ